MTVVELVVVIALIGIMASVVVPNLAALDHRTADESAADGIEALIRFGRNTAIERAESVNLTIDPANGRFWLDHPDSSGLIALPAGATMISRAKRVHVHIQLNGETSIDEAVFVRLGDNTTRVVVAP